MAKTLDEAGVKRLIQEIKGANKNLNAPIPISTENTTESMAQNVKNIADYIEKAKAAGIANVNGMAATCLIEGDYSGVGYVYATGNSLTLIGIQIYDDIVENVFFSVTDGNYMEKRIASEGVSDIVDSNMLAQGARKPIILTPDTTEVDEETYQKLLSDDVDVVFKMDNGMLCLLTLKYDSGSLYTLYFTCSSVEGETDNDVYLYGYEVTITKFSPHTCSVSENLSTDFASFLTQAGFFNKDVLYRVLKEIDLTGTDTDRKAKLDQFETDWKALTGASDLTGARFVGQITTPKGGFASVLFTYNAGISTFTGVTNLDDSDYRNHYSVYLNSNGELTITPLFSHLEAITIKTGNTTTDKADNKAAIQAYVDNLKALGVDTTKGYMIPVKLDNGYHGFIMGTDADGEHTGVIKRAQYNYGGGWIQITTNGTYQYLETLTTGSYSLTTTSKKIVNAINEINALAQGVKAFGAIELKASDNDSNKAAITAYLKILTDAGVSTTNGYSVPVRITGNSQEYHGMLNIGTGVLLSGVVTDVNENHHYPFNVSTTDGVITFDEGNYFLEKASNEVTEMLDAIKYSYTSVPFTDTTLSNKAQLEVFLSKVPAATVLHCTYNEIWAGTLHKINGDWYGLLVKNTNSPADNINVKLSADGTIIKSNSAQ